MSLEGVDTRRHILFVQKGFDLQQGVIYNAHKLYDSPAKMHRSVMSSRWTVQVLRRYKCLCADFERNTLENYAETYQTQKKGVQKSRSIV